MQDQPPTLSPDEIKRVATDLLWSLAEAVADMPENPTPDTLETLRWCARQAITAARGDVADTGAKVEARFAVDS